MRRYTRVSMSFLLVGMVIGSLGACGSMNSDDENAKDFAVPPVHWRIVSVSGPQSVRIGSSIGYCKGDVKPRYRQVQVEERHNRVYIKAFVAFPRSNSKRDICRGVGLFLLRNVPVGANLASVKLYDGRSDPPRLRWVGPAS